MLVGGGIALAVLVFVGILVFVTPDRPGPSAERFSPFEACEQARILHREGKFDAAMELWRKSGREGISTSALAMGMLNDPVLFKERFTPLSKPNPEIAEKWYRGARLLGSAEAEPRLADLTLWRSDNTLFQAGRRAPAQPADIPTACSPTLATEDKVAEMRRLFDPVPAPACDAPCDSGGRQPMAASPGSPLYAKVLTRKTVTPYLAATAQARTASQSVAPLSMLYVYGERDVDKRRWLELGASTRAKETVWLPEEDLIPWNQALVLTFAPRAHRDRALLYRKEGNLRDVLSLPQRPRAVAELTQRYCRNNNDAFQMIAAIEPDQEFNAQKNFYFMPILDHKLTTLEGQTTNLLNVAALNLHGSKAGAALDSKQVRCDHAVPSAPQKSQSTAVTQKPAAGREFRLGVAFVVDTTISMGPYIEETKRALSQFHDAMRNSDDGRGMGLALIGFRSNLWKTPAIGYDVKVFAPLTKIHGSTNFVQAVQGLEESRVSTHAFKEDSLLGVDTAINKLDWSGYDAGLIVVVTDASSMERGGGPGRRHDPLAGSEHNVEGLRDLADKKNLHISVVHILSPEGRAVGDHPIAERQYKALTKSAAANRTFYAPIVADDGVTFGRDLTSFFDAVKGLPRSIDQNKETSPDAAMPFFGKVADIGQPLRMRFYALDSNAPAPEIFNAWLSERNLADPSRMDVSVRLLLTKNQLSRLHQAISVIISSAHAAGTDSASFFKQMTELSAGAIIDPSQVGGRSEIKSLGDVGGIGKILERLPYRSRFLTLTPQDWGTMSLGAQSEFLAELEAKLAYYKTLHDQADMWISVSADSSPGDHLFPMELDRLP